jgi:hypothetical protein
MCELITYLGDCLWIEWGKEFNYGVALPSIPSPFLNLENTTA